MSGNIGVNVNLLRENTPPPPAAHGFCFYNNILTSAVVKIYVVKMMMSLMVMSPLSRLHLTAVKYGGCKYMTQSVADKMVNIIALSKSSW